MKYLALTLLATTCAFADSGTDMVAATNQQAQPVVQQPQFNEYHNRMAVFGPFHQVYERTKNDAFYVGVEAWATPVWASSDQKDGTLGEAELRFGYNFFYNGRDHVTPFVGGGVIRDFKKYSHVGRKPAVGYGVVGFLYDHEFNSWFNLGSNFKFFVGGSSSNHWLSWGSPVVGVDFSLPITFRFGKNRHWDYRIEPFDIYMHGSDISRNYIGFRNTIGYRF